MPTLTDTNPEHAPHAPPARMKSFEYTQQYRILLKPFSSLLKRPLLLSRPDYQRLSNALWQGDPAMDQLLNWLFSENPGQRKKQFEQALQHGVDSVDNCPLPIKDFFALVDSPPDWVDQQKLDEAIEFMAAVGINANYILRDVALMGGYLLAGFNQALVLTGALNKGASQRLAETSKWWMECTEKDGLKREGGGFKATIHVRMIHALVRRNLNQRKEWQSEQWGLPINQIDMAATNLAFCSLLLLGLRGLGILPTRRESQAVMHFWKYLGWLMGVDETWLVDNETDGLLLLYQTTFTQPAADWTSEVLGHALSLEPLQQEYKHFSSLKRQFSYYKHLSISRYFLGNKKMQQLGLPKGVLPWFPLLISPKNLIAFRLQRQLPILKQMQIQRGRQSQRAYMGTFGDKGKQVIQPQKNHPAYVAG